MSSVLLCGFASTGTAEDLAPLAEVLLQRGHRVTVLAGEAARQAFAGLAATFVPADEPDLPVARLGRVPFLDRVSEVFEHVRTVYVDPAPQQWELVRRTIVSEAVDVVMTDGLFFGAALLAYLPRAERPAVVDLGMFPLSVADPTVPPYGFGIPPIESIGARLQSFGLELAAAVPYGKTTRAFSAVVERLTGVRPQGDIRSAVAVADVWAQLSVDRFEYPRVAMPANVRFMGALRPPARAQAPDWWDPTDRRPVVAVLTDTGADVADLVIPTVQAFEGQEVVVVISGATRDEVESRYEGTLSEAVHFETRMPWAYFTRVRTVVVSTGDYVHTQYALRRGIPVVAAGTYGHQLETAARVDWSGVGIDLGTRRPAPRAVREAVERIRESPTIHASLARIAAQLSGHDAEEALADLVDELTADPVPVGRASGTA
jgi:UDP:flavonoid glycosyltransferase YjiC (YdhE family)